MIHTLFTPVNHKSLQDSTALMKHFNFKQIASALLRDINTQQRIHDRCTTVHQHLRHGNTERNGFLGFIVPIATNGTLLEHKGRAAALALVDRLRDEKSPGWSVSRRVHSCALSEVRA